MKHPSIDPSKEYFLDDIWQNEIIPGVDTYQKVYQLVTVAVPVEDEAGVRDGVKRAHADKTTKTSIKSYGNTRIGAKISGKIRVKGSDIIKFLQLNDVIVREEVAAA